MSKSFLQIFDKLYAYYGPQYWWPADTVFEILIGAILVQNTNWNNVEKALIRLRPVLHPEKIASLKTDELAALIRPSGYYNVKAKRIKAFLAWFKKYDYNIENIKQLSLVDLRKQLLNIRGVGKETADCMLVYAFEKPIFIVDTYARRLFKRIGLQMPDDYDDFRTQVEASLPDNPKLYNEYHALIVEHGKVHCKRKPICYECPLFHVCDQQIEDNIT
jgi:endonuclease III related protein